MEFNEVAQCILNNVRKFLNSSRPFDTGKFYRENKYIKGCNVTAISCFGTILLPFYFK